MRYFLYQDHKLRKTLALPYQPLSPYESAVQGYKGVSWCCNCNPSRSDKARKITYPCNYTGICCCRDCSLASKLGQHLHLLNYCIKYSTSQLFLEGISQIIQHFSLAAALTFYCWASFAFRQTIFYQTGVALHTEAPPSAHRHQCMLDLIEFWIGVDWLWFETTL